MSRFAYHIKPNGEAAECDLAATFPALSPGEFIWSDLDASNPETCKEVLKSFSIDTSLLDILFNKSQRPRLEIYDDYIYLSVRAVNLSKGHDPEDMINLRVLVFKDAILTFHARELQSVKLIKEALVKHQKFASPLALLTKLVSNLNDFIFQEVEELGEELSTLEDVGDLNQLIKQQEQLSDIRRTIMGLQKYLNPQVGIMHRLWEVNLAWFKKRERLSLKNQAEKTSTLVGDMEHLRQRAVILDDDIKTVVSDQMNQTVFRLTVLSAVMLPLGLFAGLMGANVGGMPFAEDPLGFIYLCALSIGFGVGVFILMKVLKWI